MITAIWTSSILMGFLSLYSTGRKKRIWNLCVLLAAVLFISCNNMSPDEVNLEITYYSNAIMIKRSSILYDLLVFLFHRIPVSFGVFNAITALAALLLIVKMLSCYTKSWGFALALYMLSAAVLDVSLYRQFLASAFVVFGFRYLITDQKNIGKYVICILLAALIHVALIVYLIFGILAFENKVSNRLYKYMIWGISIFGAALSIGTFLNGRVIPGISFVERLICGQSGSKLEGYIQSAGGRFGWLLAMLLWLLSIMAVSIFEWCKDNIQVNRKILSDHIETQLNRELRLSTLPVNIQNIKEIFVLSICFLPFCIMMVTVFLRLYRPLVWLAILLIVILAERVPKKILDIRILAGTTIYLGYYFICYNCIFYDWKLCTEMIFQGTLFWM